MLNGNGHHMVMCNVYFFCLQKLYKHCLLNSVSIITSNFTPGTGSMFNPNAMMGGASSGTQQSGGSSQSAGSSQSGTSSSMFNPNAMMGGGTSSQSQSGGSSQSTGSSQSGGASMFGGSSSGSTGKVCIWCK